MKLGIVLDQQLHSGGGFQQALNAIRQILRIRPEWLDIEVFTTSEANAKHPALSALTLHVVRRGLSEKLRHNVLSGAMPEVIDRQLSKIGITTQLERAMQNHKVDLVYFVVPTTYALAFRNLPYVLTVWDLCHRDYPEFPEVGSGPEFSARENLYRRSINRAYLTLTDSNELNDHICRRYGTDADRLVAMPFQPAKFDQATDKDTVVLGEVADLGNLPKDYLFYPAQFWPHKNHARILQALAHLKQHGHRFPVVFCGGDKGNRPHLQATAERLGIADQVSFLGFVDEKHMQSLYAASKALVMPTYFGMTNLPPLEAWQAGKPVIYSKHLFAQVGEAALCVNPDSVTQLADAISLVYESKHTVECLVEKGRDKLREIEEQRIEAESLFLDRLNVFRARRLCWE